MLGISMLVTFDPLLSLPKAAGLYYGIVVYFILINNLSWILTKRIVLPALILAGFVVAGLSLFGMRWSGAKLPFIGTHLVQLGKRIPRLLHNIPRAEKGISPNQLGGMLILLIPMQITLFIYSVKSSSPKNLDWVHAIACGIVSSLSFFVLLMTQSRGAIAALFVVLGALTFFYLRRMQWLIVTAMTLSLIFGGILFIKIPAVEVFSETEEIFESLALKSRPEIWSRAYRMLTDHIYTGIGFDTFSQVLSTRYPTFQIPAEKSRVIPHAHNLYLQTALDLGIPGLIAFLSLHAICGWMLIRIIRYTSSSFVRAVSIGLFLGLLAQVLYGWIDCIALGQKPSIFFWIYLALSSVIFFDETQQDIPEDV
jgi:putative inorganic carbon (HCO3(-)) transporter